MATTGKRKKRGDKKCYVLLVSRTFPSDQPKGGQPTYFVEKIHRARGTYSLVDSLDLEVLGGCTPKLHTVRLNYELWKKRFEEIAAGTAYLSLRYWLGKPYKSPQEEFMQLHSTDGIGIQKLRFNIDAEPVIDDVRTHKDYDVLAANDGLSREDFNNWFGEKIYFHNPDPYVIIHFTKFRYEKEN